MQAPDRDQLFADIKTELVAAPGATLAILGHTSLSYDIRQFLISLGVASQLLGIYSNPVMACCAGSIKEIRTLAVDVPAVVIVASDELKQELLVEAAPYLAPRTRIIMAGYGHFQFRDPVYDSVVRDALVPSLANGYPHTLVHLYQCLANAARLGLRGVVAEFGMFKGGTTMMLSRFVERLGQSWPVIGFDTFAGFPPRRSCLDMYAHPGCVCCDESAIRRHLAGRNVEVVAGDICSTVARIAGEDVVLAFVDTDNYTPAAAVLDVIQDRVLVGGAIAFDHVTGRNRFVYTLGERIAAVRLMDDARYFHLHDTGVFLRQR